MARILVYAPHDPRWSGELVFDGECPDAAQLRTEAEAIVADMFPSDTATDFTYLDSLSQSEIDARDARIANGDYERRETNGDITTLTFSTWKTKVEGLYPAFFEVPSY